MAGGMKSLAKDTAIYGGSTILSKLLAWILSLYWAFALQTRAEMGAITNFYAWIALFQVILTYGMETGFFRFANLHDNPQKVFTTAQISIYTTTFLFFLLSAIFIHPIAQTLSNFGLVIEPVYIRIIFLILCFDIITAIPFAYLRFAKRPIRFASIRIANVGITLILNIFVFSAIPAIHSHFPSLFGWFDVKDGVFYILCINLIASIIQLFLLSPQIFVKYEFDGALLKKIFGYSFPLMILGIAGVLNQTMDKIIFPMLYPDKSQALTQLGIYGQSFKIAIIMVMFTQAFRYAFEPFIFAKQKGNNKKSYADASKYFLIFGLLIFLGTMGYLDIIKKIIPQNYHEGLKVVPIVMLGELFFGLYFNLSLWYKLTDKTRWGAYMSIFGFIITLFIQVAFIPKFSYMACAWSAFFANLVMMVVSYFLGQKYYPINYDLKSASFFSLIALIGFAIISSTYTYIDNIFIRLTINSVVILLYLFIIFKKELSLHSLPYIGKYFK